MSVRASRSCARRVGTPRKARATERTSATATMALISSGSALTCGRLPRSRADGKGSDATSGTGAPVRNSALQRLELFGDVADRALGVAEEHAGLGVDEQRV